jgi:hypothetical protein
LLARKYGNGLCRSSGLEFERDLPMASRSTDFQKR